MVYALLISGNLYAHRVFGAVNQTELEWIVLMLSNQCYIAQSDVVDCDIGGDRALLHLETNTYFTMNATASALWLGLSEPKSIEDMIKIVTEKFDVSDDACRPDIEALIGQMVEANVVKIVPGEAV